MRVITKSDDRAAGVLFVYQLIIKITISEKRKEKLPSYVTKGNFTFKKLTKDA